MDTLKEKGVLTVDWISSREGCNALESNEIVESIIEEKMKDIRVYYVTCIQCRELNKRKTLILSKAELENEDILRNDYDMDKILWSELLGICGTDFNSKQDDLKAIEVMNHEVIRLKLSKQSRNQAQTLSPVSSVTVTKKGTNKRIEPVKASQNMVIESSDEENDDQMMSEQKFITKPKLNNTTPIKRKKATSKITSFFTKK